MPIINVVWMNNLFWDGREAGLEAQALVPVEDLKEMKADWNIIVEKLKKHPVYSEMFDDAFTDMLITKELASDALVQFEKTLISANSKFDRYKQGGYDFTDAEQRGHDLFFSEQADCFHCHAGGLMLTDLEFHNNGLETVPKDLGLENFTGNAIDRGKFKTSTLKNIALTAPYMHDGRFNTLDEVLDFYSSGVQESPTVDPLMKFSEQGGVILNAQEKADLKAFLWLFTDEEFLSNPDFASPF